MNYNLLFAVIAPREVVFFSNIADFLKDNYGINSSFLTFYEPGDKILKRKGYKVFSLHKEAKKFYIEANVYNVKKLEEKFKISNIRSLILHEKLTFQRYDEQKLITKLLSYDAYFNHILKNNKFDFIVQELGAFIAPISLYFSARAMKVNHIFIEPALFRGYVFFNFNNIDVNIEKVMSSYDMAKSIINDYHNQYHKFKTIAVPLKDKHHFMDAGLKKIINMRNIKRLSEKLYYKYVRREKEEYDAIYNHFERNLMSVIRRTALTSLYTKYNIGKKYVYFPLHVPLDFQLTFREPRYLNQIAIVEYLSNVLPYDIELFIKEHPASIGAYDYWQLKKILKNNNIKLISPEVNSYDIIKNSMFVITINSKVGVEALFQGKKVYALGSPYYLSNKYAVKLGSLDDVKKLDFSPESYTNLFYDEEFFKQLATSVSKGELYVNTSENIENFSKSLVEVIKNESIAHQSAV